MGYPRSFLGLLLAGFTLVALPLVAALPYSAWNTERLTEQSRNAVYSASQAARASRSLVNRIGSIERLAQQMAMVNDPELAADYQRGRARASRVSELVTSRSSTIPTGGISLNSPFETAAPNCTERMPIRTSDTGEKRAAGTGSGYRGWPVPRRLWRT